MTIKAMKIICLVQSLHCAVVCCSDGTIAECREGEGREREKGRDGQGRGWEREDGGVEEEGREEGKGGAE